MRWYDFDGDEVRARDPLLEGGRPAEPSGGASNHAAVEQPWTPWSYGARAQTIVADHPAGNSHRGVSRCEPGQGIPLAQRGAHIDLDLTMQGQRGQVPVRVERDRQWARGHAHPRQPEPVLEVWREEEPGVGVPRRSWPSARGGTPGCPLCQDEACDS